MPKKPPKGRGSAAAPRPPDGSSPGPGPPNDKTTVSPRRTVTSTEEPVLSGDKPTEGSAVASSGPASGPNSSPVASASTSEVNPASPARLPSSSGSTSPMAVSPSRADAEPKKPLTAAQVAAAADVAKANKIRQSAEDKWAEQKKRSRLEKEAKNEAIRLALWPTTELESLVKRKALVDKIDYVRLASSTTWRDTWYEFNRKANPTGKDRDRVISVAVSILQRKEGGKTRHSKPSSGNVSMTKSTAPTGSKRERAPSSSSSTSSTGSVLRSPQFKIPKHSKDKPASATTTSSVEPAKKDTTAPAVEDESMETPEVVEGEANEPPLENFATDMHEALSSGYADAAKGKKRKQDYPFLLYIHKGSELRETMGRDTWKVLLQKAQTRIMDLTLEEGFAPNVDWTGFKNGTGVIATTDDESRTFVKKVIDELTVEGKAFKAWPKGEKETKTFVTIKLPASMKGYATGKIIQVLEKANKIPETSWYLFNVRDFHGTGERLVKMVVDETCVLRLYELNGELQVGLSRVEVQKGGTRMTPF